MVESGAFGLSNISQRISSLQAHLLTRQHHTSPTSTKMSTDKIDSLLQQYLLLLNEYTTLRTTLNNLQSSLYQHLARANFSAQPGVRHYGQDYYDERMQSTSHLDITISSETNTPEFSLVRPPITNDKPSEKPKPNDNTKEQPQTQDGPGSTQHANNSNPSSPHPPPKDEAGDSKARDEAESKRDDSQPTPTSKHKNSTNPLHWFGILTPLPLRLAQADAKTAVEDIIPKLATLSEQMKALEVEVRRERKKRAKAEKEESKQQKDQNRGRCGGISNYQLKRVK